MIQQFDNRFFYYRIKLIDASGIVKELTNSAVLNLTISDSILSPFEVGRMTVVDMFNAVRNGCDNTSPPLNFIGNNRDILCVEIMPNISGDIMADFNNAELFKNFGMRYVFALNEIRDAAENDVADCTTFIFRDIHLQHMLEHSLNISTSKTTNGNINSSNSERTEFSGEFLKKALNKLYEGPESVIDEENFDRGYAKIFYSPVMGVNAYDDITNILQLHAGQGDEMPCFLKKERNHNKFTLRSLKTLFDGQRDNPKEYVYDSFVLSNGQPGDVSNSFRGTQGLIYESSIINFKTASINGDYIVKVARNLISLFESVRDKNFIMFSKDSNLQQIQQLYDRVFVSPFKHLHEAGKVVPAFDVQLLAKSTELSPTIQGFTKSRKLPSTLMKDALLGMLIAGNNIVFRVPGSTHRRSGKFIDIVTESSIANSFQSTKLLGRWLVTKVSHVFVGSKYYNVIEAVKPYDTIL